MNESSKINPPGNAAKPLPPKTEKPKKGKTVSFRTLGPVSDLERHLPPEWWKKLFNSLYLKTDGDVVENDANTIRDIDMVINTTGIRVDDHILDLCCGQGRHSLELARRGYRQIAGVDRSRYLIRLARRRAKHQGLSVIFSEGDARKFRMPESSRDCVILMGNSFGFFEHEQDDIAVLNSVKRVLKAGGKMVLDIVDGVWMAKNFERRSWEWIDQSHFVNRERSLSADGKRIVSREVITNAELGVLADQFYAERLYTVEEIIATLFEIGFINIVSLGNVATDSTRGQDLGFMANRIFITAEAPPKTTAKPASKVEIVKVTAIMGDPRLPDPVKKNGKFNPEDIETINILKRNLEKLDNYEFSYLDDHKALMQELIAKPPAFVLNLCDEGYNNQPELELHISAMLEMLGIPYTGSGPGALSLCYNKSFVRAIAISLDIDVPMETFYDPADQAVNLPSFFPALLKPNFGDSSIGITKDAVVNTGEEFLAYLDHLREILPGVPILVQEYLQGREYSVGLIGNADKFEVLPVLEVDYSRLPEELPKILSYESKWLPNSPYWTDIKYKEADLDGESIRKLSHFSSRLFERLGCRDYARFDFRADSHGIIKLLEVNPNPGWCWDGKFNLMAGFAGIEYNKLLDMILNAARERIESSAKTH